MRPRAPGVRRHRQGGGGFLDRATRHHDREGVRDRVSIWVDGSWDRDGFASWAAVVRFPDGRTQRAAGALPRGIHGADVEVFAVIHALDLAGDADVVIHTDCRAIPEALRGTGRMEVSSWTLLERRIAAHPGRVEARWRRRKSSASMIAVHHLANAARLFSAIGVPASIDAFATMPALA